MCFKYLQQHIYFNIFFVHELGFPCFSAVGPLSCGSCPPVQPRFHLRLSGDPLEAALAHGLRGRLQLQQHQVHLGPTARLAAGAGGAGGAGGAPGACGKACGRFVGLPERWLSLWGAARLKMEVGPLSCFLEGGSKKVALPFGVPLQQHPEGAHETKHHCGGVNQRRLATLPTSQVSG